MEEPGCFGHLDLGLVSFGNIDHRFVGVSDAIVWASRMASAASASEVVVNNLLYHVLSQRDGLEFGRRQAATRSGQGFLARGVSAKVKKRRA